MIKPLAVLACASLALAAPAQQPFSVPGPSTSNVTLPAGPRKLHGRFLHITDMHPDPYYKTGTSESTACHRKKPRKEKTRAEPWGTPHGDCDSPFRLTNRTLKWLEKHWADEIDFVVWTGDNARHDNDRRLPRTLKEIYMLNGEVASKMQSIFTKRGIPVVPSLGNNDVWREFSRSTHAGPNDIISKFASIWRPFIPFPSYQVFQRGAYYSVEVIPNQVAVIALNTMYFYDSNKAVGGCEYSEPHDPGNLQLDWLEVQLQIFRERGMHVRSPGHVPPSVDNYFPECHVRYAELALRYQDTILGHLFGHMNNDHFFFIEALNLEFPPEDDVRIRAHDGLYDDLLDDFGRVRRDKARDEADYAVVNVSPSVVPNPLLPSFRIFSYNITGAKHLDADSALKKNKKKHHRGDGGPEKGDRFEKCKNGGGDGWRCHLDKPWHSSPDAPSRTNTLWSPLGYAQVRAFNFMLRWECMLDANLHGSQYYLPPGSLSNATEKPKFKLEYMTYELDALHPADGSAGPIPKKELPKSLRKRTKKNASSKFAPYGLPDLTVGSWLALADKLGGSGAKKVKKRFRKYMFMGGED
ncbi:hypothetical protein PENSPDRAFT_576601 [Peniophora sp. CONT]|nr:hypothetical protein PENSPDRAFT_576601 [Peniophora sp. CONT]